MATGFPSTQGSYSAAVTGEDMPLHIKKIEGSLKPNTLSSPDETNLSQLRPTGHQAKLKSSPIIRSRGPSDLAKLAEHAPKGIRHETKALLDLPAQPTFRHQRVVQRPPQGGLLGKRLFASTPYSPGPDKRQNCSLKLLVLGVGK